MKLNYIHDTRSNGLTHLKELVESWDDYPGQLHMVRLLREEGFDVLAKEVDGLDPEQYHNFIKEEVYEVENG